MIEEVHIVQKNIFDLEIDDKGKAQGVQDEVSRIFYSSLQAIMASVFEELNPEDVHLVFNRLEIDLGEIHESQLALELPHKFERELRKTLSWEIGNLVHSPQKRNDKGEMVLLPKARLSQLLHFLEKGSLPLSASFEEKELPQKLFREMVQTKGPELIAAIQRLPSPLAAIKRIIGQMRETDREVFLNAMLTGKAEARAYESMIKGEKEKFHTNVRSERFQLEFEEKLRIRTLHAIITAPSSFSTSQSMQQLVSAEAEEIASDMALSGALSLAPPEILSPKEKPPKASSPHLSSKAHSEEEKEEENTRDVDQDLSNQSGPKPETKANKGTQKETEEGSSFRQEAWEASYAIENPYLPSRSGSGQGQKEDWGAVWDYVKYFLSEGVEPWWANENHGSSPTQKVSELLRSQAVPLQKFLKELSDKQATVQERLKLLERLTVLLAEPDLLKLTQSIIPDFAGFHHSLILLTQSYLQNKENLSEKAASEQSWKAGLLYLFHPGKLSFSLDGAVKFVVSQIQLMSGKRLDLIIPDLSQVIQATDEANKKRFSVVQNIIRQSFPDIHLNISKSGDEPGPKESREEVSGAIPQPKKESEADFSHLQTSSIEGIMEVLSVQNISDQKKAQDEKSARTKVLSALDRWYQKPSEQDSAKEDKRALKRPPSGEEILENNEALAQFLTLFQYYLSRGSLQDSLFSNSKSQFVENILLLAEKKPAIFRDVLSKAPGNEARKRLINLIPPDRFGLVAKAMGSSEAINRNHQELVQLIAKTQPGLQKSLNEHLLYYSSLPTATEDEINYQRSMVRFVSREQDVEQYELIDLILPDKPEQSKEGESPLQKSLKAIRKDVESLPRRKKRRDKEAERQEAIVRWYKEGEDEVIYVKNAGLVLVWPFLGFYFKRLNLLNDEKKFKDEASMVRGVLLLQHLATGRTEFEEYELPLNKVICGMPLEFVVPTSIELTDEEAEISKALFGAVSKNWEVVKKSSPDGIRGTFLARDGKLSRKGEHWYLKVEMKGFDIILDRLPWGLSLVRFSWMPYLLHIEWR